jgi:iron complex transport system permease protein
MTDTGTSKRTPRTTPRPRWYQRLPWLLLCVLLVGSVLYSLSSGAVSVGARQSFHIIWDHFIRALHRLAVWDEIVDTWDGFAALPGIGAIVGLVDKGTQPLRSWLTPAYTARDDSVIWQIRVPRVFLGVAVGGLIALAAALLQSAFRNPLADPGLVGIASTGAWAAFLTTFLPTWSLVGDAPWSWLLKVVQPGGAIFACLAVTCLLWWLARRSGTIEPMTFVLAGLAVNAMAIAGIGLTNAIKGNVLEQATSFWATGGLSQATWYPVQATWAVLVVGAIVTPFLGRSLNVLALGDREARHIGIHVPRLRIVAVVIAAILLGFASAYAGAIVFVGLIVPQFLRLWLGPDIRKLTAYSPLAGAIVIVVADLAARTIADPIEIGIGLVLTFVGGPLFIGILLQMRRRSGAVA